MEHTPGPWRVAPDAARESITPIHSASGKNVAATPHTERGIADAALIAAAPDLLAALKILADHASETYPHFESERGVRDIAAARAAIAAATGQKHTPIEMDLEPQTDAQGAQCDAPSTPPAPHGWGSVTPERIARAIRHENEDNAGCSCGNADKGAPGHDDA